ncbi:catalase [Sporosarcina sp.]|uniref:catalase n=1 Tax=Sporosarcina sp. TaxID=49982 RepID=UPI00262FA7D8|nr:catalase [Sporosarcina sp.]
MKNPTSLSASDAINAIESAVPIEKHLRRAHSFGIAFKAVFQPTGAAIPWSTAAHLQKKEVPAIVRFSHSSTSPDSNKRLNPVKGMAVRFHLADGTFTNLTMVNLPVFISETPEAFIGLLKTFDSDKSGWSDRLNFLLHSAHYKAFATILKKLKPFKNFETLHYYAIHTYYLVNEKRQRQAVRFEWQPLPSNASNSGGTNTENALLQKVEAGDPIRFRLLIQLADQGDTVDNPTIAWPSDRRKIEAGVLTLTSLCADNAEELVFDPTVTISGLECSEDPVLLFRSAAYEESARRRGVMK